MKYLVLICRILVGVLFIISGLIKANDTIGFAYKLEEYYQVFGTEFLISTAVLQASLICIVEVALGVLLLLGSRIKLTLWLLTGMILFFTFLTFYSAYYNKVTDCGCFGDALKLKPWQSFQKDVALLILISVLVIGRKYIQPLASAKVLNVVFLISLAFTIYFPFFTYNHMPVVDFRPYAVGKDIQKGMQGGIPPKFDTKFLYKNLQTGKVEEFEQPPYQDTISWEVDTLKYQFVDQKQTEIDPGVPALIHDFSISNAEGSDITEDVFNYKGYQFLLVSYNLAKADRGVQSQINDFANLCEKEKIPFYGLTSDIPSVIDDFRHEVQAPYNYYITDATQLKTMIRSNPGLMLLKGPVVVAMWHHNDFPALDAVKKKYFGLPVGTN